MEIYTNISLYCDKCVNCKPAGEIQVGSIESGGIEMSYSCSKNRNMTYYWYNNIPCPDFEDEDSNYY